MHLELSPVTPSDLDVAAFLYGPESGDLAAAAAQVCWPVGPADLAAQKHRAEWSCQQQKDLLCTDSSVRFVKVIDTDAELNQQIVAFGRWHEYPNGYTHVKDLEVTGLKDRNDPATWPEGMNKAFYTGFLDDCFAGRRKWMGDGHYWVLTNIVTRAPLRKHGAGSMILQWGLEQAKKAGVPAYLEAVPEAKRLYESHGFKEVARQTVDCTAYGMPGVTFETSEMRADP